MDIISDMYLWFDHFRFALMFLLRLARRTLPSIYLTCFTFAFTFTFTFSFTYPLTARVIGAPQMTSQPVSSTFPCSPPPSGTLRTPGLSIPSYCLSTSFFLSALSASRFHCALQDDFCRIGWTGDMSTPLQFASLYDGQDRELTRLCVRGGEWSSLRP